MRPIRHARPVRDLPSGLELDCGSGLTCRITLADEYARVLFVRPEGVRQRRSWMVPAPGTHDTPWDGRDRMEEVATGTISRSDDGLTLTASGIGVRISLDPFRLEWLLPDGRVFLADRAGMPYMLGHRTPAVAHYLARDPEDRFYGLGDKTGALDLHGRRLRTRMTDALGYDPQRGDPLYKHWPFVLARDAVTGTAYGVFYDNTAVAAFDLGCEHDNYHGLFRGYEAEDGDLDYYVLAGPRLADVTPRFLRLIGGTALPPRWTLGYAQTAMAITDAPDAQARIGAFIERSAQEDVPISAFHFGSGYTSIGPKRYVFNWNNAKFPDPHALLRQFKAANIRVVANLKPCLLDDHPRYADVAAQGGFVTDGATGQPLLSQFWDGEGAHIDFTSAAGIAWWQAGLERAILDTGMDVGWNDNNEYELWDEDATCNGFGTPTPLALTRPIQALLMTRATLEAEARRAPEERVFTVTRAGCPGIQRYAQTWSGDNSTSWDSLRWNLRTGLQMSMSGMYNIGHDIGGFSGPIPDPELLTRWTQAGAVHPRFIMNSWKPGTIINSPWLHAESLPAIRDTIRMRYRLVPLFYSLMHAAVSDDAPILQPTFVAFDADPRTAQDSDELMLGTHILAAPVVEQGARERRVYLPAGPEAWFSFHDGAQHPAGAEVTVPAPLEHLPLFVAAGGIVPTTDEAAGYARLHDEPSRCLRLYPGPQAGRGEFTLVEDDGISAHGKVTRLHCALDWTTQAVTLTVTASGDYPLPYAELAVHVPPGEHRTLTLDGRGVTLTRRSWPA